MANILCICECVCVPQRESDLERERERERERETSARRPPSATSTRPARSRERRKTKFFCERVFARPNADQPFPEILIKKEPNDVIKRNFLFRKYEWRHRPKNMKTTSAFFWWGRIFDPEFWFEAFCGEKAFHVLTIYCFLRGKVKQRPA